MTAYYFDAVAGIDSAAGTSPATAWKTESKLRTFAFASGDTVSLNRGNTWVLTATLTLRAAVTYGAYGTGVRPIISGVGRSPSVRVAGNNGRLNDWDLSGGAIVFSNTSGGGAQTGWIVTNVRIHGGTSNGASQNSVDNFSCTFVDCEFDHNSLLGFYWEYPLNLVFRNCSFHENGKTGLGWNGQVDPTNCLVTNCTFYNNGEDGLSINNNGRGDIVEYCVAFGNGTALNDRTGLKTFGNRTIFRYCDSYDNNLNFLIGCGFQTDLNSSDCVFHHCKAWNNRNAGISLTGTGHKVYNCTFARNKKGGIEFFTIGAPVNNVKFKNNIVANNGNTGDTNDSQGRFCVSDDQNLLASAAGMELDYNVYQPFSGGQAVMFRWANVNYATLAAFVAARGQDTHSKQTDPLMVNPAAADFHLQPSSPCVNAGTVLTGYTDGYVGSAPDIGAYELAVSNPLGLAAGQWTYDTATGKLYVRTTDSTSPASKDMAAFDWRFGVEEILMVQVSGVLKGRLCRHFSYASDPTVTDINSARGGSVSYDGSKVAFGSNWGGGTVGVYVALTDPSL